jgi:hypothetical protein
MNSTMYLSAQGSHGKVYFVGRQPHWSQGRTLADEFVRETYGDDYVSRYLTGSLKMCQATYSIIYLGKHKPNLGYRNNLRKEVKL